jgi:hypothetical protein
MSSLAAEEKKTQQLQLLCLTSTQTFALYIDQVTAQPYSSHDCLDI